MPMHGPPLPAPDRAELGAQDPSLPVQGCPVPADRGTACAPVAAGFLGVPRPTAAGQALGSGCAALSVFASFFPLSFSPSFFLLSSFPLSLLPPPSPFSLPPPFLPFLPVFLPSFLLTLTLETISPRFSYLGPRTDDGDLLAQEQTKKASRKECSGALGHRTPARWGPQSGSVDGGAGKTAPPGSPGHCSGLLLLVKMGGGVSPGCLATRTTCPHKTAVPGRQRRGDRVHTWLS